MKHYDYREAMADDIREYISDWINLTDWAGDADGLYEHLYDILWVDDCVTGNGSGSYTFDRWQAEENLCHNLDLLAEICRDWGIDWDILENPEAADVTIRCYLLGEVVWEVVNDLDLDLDLDEAEVNVA